MNISNLINRIKIACGLYVISTPFENVDEFIRNIIVDITRRTFSNFCPVYDVMYLNLNELNYQDIKWYSDRVEFLLPDIFHERELLFIRDIDYSTSGVSYLGTSPNYKGAASEIGLNNTLMMANAQLQLANLNIAKLNFNFRYPRTVTLFNVHKGLTLKMELAFIHDKNLHSITPTMEEEFYNLAVLDVKDALYETMKHYNDIQTAHGNISMKLDEWQQAGDLRKTLLDEWNNIYHIDILPIYFS